MRDEISQYLVLIQRVKRTDLHPIPPTRIYKPTDFLPFFARTTPRHTHHTPSRVPYHKIYFITISLGEIRHDKANIFDVFVNSGLFPRSARLVVSSARTRNGRLNVPLREFKIGATRTGSQNEMNRGEDGERLASGTDSLYACYAERSSSIPICRLRHSIEKGQKLTPLYHAEPTYTMFNIFLVV